MTTSRVWYRMWNFPGWACLQTPLVWVCCARWPFPSLRNITLLVKHTVVFYMYMYIPHHLGEQQQREGMLGRPFFWNHIEAHYMYPTPFCISEKCQHCRLARATVPIRMHACWGLPHMPHTHQRCLAHVYCQSLVHMHLCKQLLTNINYADTVTTFQKTKLANHYNHTDMLLDIQYSHTPGSYAGTSLLIIMHTLRGLDPAESTPHTQATCTAS